MKKVLIIVTSLILLTVWAFTGCTQTPTETTSPEPDMTQESAPATSPPEADPTPEPDKPVKIGFTQVHMQNPCVVEQADGVMERAKELGADITLADAMQDVQKQLDQVDNFIAQGVDVIVMQPVSFDGSKPAVEAANAAGVPIVIFNATVVNVDQASSFVGVSHEEAGELQMELCAAAMNGEGNLAVLQGGLAADSQISRMKGEQNIIDQNPDINVVFEQTGNWVRAEGLTVTENWLQSNKTIDAIIAHNDDMALGAIAALESENMLDSVLVFGIDGTPDAFKAIKEGKLAGTVSQMSYLQGQKAAETAIAIVKGEPYEKEILVNQVAVDINNIDDFMN